MARWQHSCAIVSVLKRKGVGKVLPILMYFGGSYLKVAYSVSLICVSVSKVQNVLACKCGNLKRFLMVNTS